ncbi:MAG: hypothetical protein AAGF79_21190 [Pseudomonadota bacterium]
MIYLATTFLPRPSRATAIALLAVCAMSACAPQIPDSAAGVGFDGPSAPILQPEPLASPLPPADAISSEELPSSEFLLAPAPASAPGLQSASSGNVATGVTPTGSATGLTTTSATSGSGADIAADTAAALAAAQLNSGVLPVEADPENAPPVALNNPGISDENDFQAVASRQSIASDAQRLEQQAAQREVIAPTSVPTRPASSDPNIVQYALATQHPKGSRVYTRSGINLASKAQRNCAKYTSPDQAQIDFLLKGGPDRDRLSLDPDGDGYACGWDPAPFRAAIN